MDKESGERLQSCTMRQAASVTSGSIWSERRRGVGVGGVTWTETVKAVSPQQSFTPQNSLEHSWDVSEPWSRRSVASESSSTRPTNLSSEMKQKSAAPEERGSSSSSAKKEREGLPCRLQKKGHAGDICI